MSTHKHIDRICIAAIILSLVFTLLFLNGEALGIQPASKAMGYENRLFDTSEVHTIDIVMDDWEDFIENCENEEYVTCTAIIDGEAYKNIGIRAKGNTSLRNVSAMNSDRYSFKLEFDHYDSGKNYYGLDKLSLNNMIQDTTYMKDYLTYQMMGEFEVDSPLCSYAYIRVNGEDWGLYLAVEGVEDAFLQRNYGNNHGSLYKPDSMSFGGGKGNGREFDMENFMANDDMPDMSEQPPSPPEKINDERMDRNREDFGNAPGGMGSSDVKLQYIDDDPDSYSNIFDNAKTDIDNTDKTRLIQSLKALSELSNLEEIVTIDKVIRYFVVHNFVCNGDSYTGSIIHNYYLYEDNGQLSMIPWDYNLAFGTFQSKDANSMINSPIDTPVSGGATDDRPMVDWIFSSQEYEELYHQLFAKFLENTDFLGLIDTTYELIAPYVEKDPSKFYSYEEFETGVSVLKEFCLLRKESVGGQLAGIIPSDKDGQSADNSSLVDASHITLSDMGSMGGEHGGPDGGMHMAGNPHNDTGAINNPDNGMENNHQPNNSDIRQAWAEDSAVSPEQNPNINHQFTPPDRNAKNMSPGQFSEPATDIPTPYSRNVWILLAVSGIVLLGGLLVAFKFKRS